MKVIEVVNNIVKSTPYTDYIEELLVSCSELNLYEILNGLESDGSESIEDTWLKREAIFSTYFSLTLHKEVPNEVRRYIESYNEIYKEFIDDTLSKAVLIPELDKLTHEQFIVVAFFIRETITA
jgi:hypothetical protein